MLVLIGCSLHMNLRATMPGTWNYARCQVWIRKSYLNLPGAYFSKYNGRYSFLFSKVCCVRARCVAYLVFPFNVWLHGFKTGLQSQVSVLSEIHTNTCRVFLANSKLLMCRAVTLMNCGWSWSCLPKSNIPQSVVVFRSLDLNVTVVTRPAQVDSKLGSVLLGLPTNIFVY